ACPVCLVLLPAELFPLRVHVVFLRTPLRLVLLRAGLRLLLLVPRLRRLARALGLVRPRVARPVLAVNGAVPQRANAALTRPHPRGGVASFPRGTPSTRSGLATFVGSF